ncbi:MAG: cupredoxin domain-containing protein [Proteobacteria bacterium]|nr:cupredoxin domain-containing protein [Pseudomonadota bacterium]
MMTVAVATLGIGMVRRALADDPVRVKLTLKDHRFTPDELRVPAGQPIEITVDNQDDKPEEFESKALKVEKVISGNRSATVKVAPLKAGRYPFEGEYNSKTARGVLIAE